MGETNALAARRRTPTCRATLLRALALYGERFGLPDGRIPAVRDPVPDRLGVGDELAVAVQPSPSSARASCQIA
jgi:hypothetical protein